MVLFVMILHNVGGKTNLMYFFMIAQMLQLLLIYLIGIVIKPYGFESRSK